MLGIGLGGFGGLRLIGDAVPVGKIALPGVDMGLKVDELDAGVSDGVPNVFETKTGVLVGGTPMVVVDIGG